MFEEFSKRNKAVRAGARARRGGRLECRDLCRDCRPYRAESCRSPPRLHLEDRPAQGVSKRGRWRGAGQGETCQALPNKALAIACST